MSITAAARLLTDTIRSKGKITVLTGAGVSAESGIPTFRGPEGFWTIGSREYRPQEMATWAMFSQDPESVWAWYLYRMGLCQQAQPNNGHHALVSMESLLGDQFTLITQNVDNLHILAGNSLPRTFQIHGNLFQARCASACTDTPFPLPGGLSPKHKGEGLSDRDRQWLTCPSCGNWIRPHVLWFDESYNQHHYHFDSALETAQRTQLLITAGTSGATTLPNHIVDIVHRNNGLMIDINVADNTFASVVTQSKQGIVVQEPSSIALAELARTTKMALSNL